jgi:hypothetical protein
MVEKARRTKEAMQEASRRRGLRRAPLHIPQPKREEVKLPPVQQKRKPTKEPKKEETFLWSAQHFASSLAGSTTQASSLQVLREPDPQARMPLVRSEPTTQALTSSGPLAPLDRREPRVLRRQRQRSKEGVTEE